MRTISLESKHRRFPCPPITETLLWQAGGGFLIITGLGGYSLHKSIIVRSNAIMDNKWRSFRVCCARMK